MGRAMMINAPRLGLLVAMGLHQDPAIRLLVMWTARRRAALR